MQERGKADVAGVTRQESGKLVNSMTGSRRGMSSPWRIQVMLVAGLGNSFLYDSGSVVAVNLVLSTVFLGLVHLVGGRSSVAVMTAARLVRRCRPNHWPPIWDAVARESGVPMGL